MKKRLEAELISIAHRVLKLKNKSEIDQLYIETQKLYTVLGVLKFYNDNIDVSKNTLSESELEDLLQKEEAPLIEKEPVVVAEIPPVEIIVEEEQEELLAEDDAIEIEEEEEELVEEEVLEEEEEEIAEEEVEDEELEENEGEENEDENPLELEAEIGFNFEPSEDFLLKSDEETKEEAKPEVHQFTFEDLLGGDYVEPVFVKPNDVSTLLFEEFEEKEAPISDKSATGISIGINDRIGFVNNLFGGSDEDYNRVISQLNSFDSFKEAEEFIEDFVKPDYNNWEDVADYEERFLEIVAKKFE